MEIITNPTQVEIKKAAQALKESHLVAFPTETVYGLGADATNEQAVSRIYSVKGRPTDHPLIVHISSINKLEDWATDIPDYAIKLAKEFWPGPMTLILPRKDIAKDFITGGQDSVGLRVPDQSVALALLSEFEKLGGLGVAAPSANRFGAVSPTTAGAVEEELGAFFNPLDLVLDGGQCRVGIESTIIDCTNSMPQLLRPGAVTKNMIRFMTQDSIIFGHKGNDTRTSGLLESHYAPKARVLLNKPASFGDGFIALHNIPTPEGSIRLGKPIDVEAFARDLYSSLRKGDNLNLSTIIVILPESGELKDAIKDRMIKASCH